MEEIELPFQSEEFKETWNEWISYRKERKIAKYVPRGLKMTFNKLIADSGNDEKVAIQMIEQSMSNNWQGLFAIKQQYGQSINKNGTNGTDRIAALKKW